MREEFRASVEHTQALKRALENEEKKLEESKESSKQLFKRWKRNQVVLNVGGTIYHTSRQTLQSIPGTIFAEVLEGDIQELKSEKDGTIFIDRSGENFRYILDFLRNPD